MNVVIIKYNAGNVQSVLFALERLGISPVLSDDPVEISAADKVIFPGVGQAATTMNYLKSKKLDVLIRSLNQPVLGICLGMQLMCAHSEEGNVPCLGIFEQQVKKFIASSKENTSYKVPQMGWNNIYNLQSPLFNSVSEDEHVYFVHSYYAELSQYTIATTNYMLEYSSALQKNNFYAVQFHPEKSSNAGQKILENFIKL